MSTRVDIRTIIMRADPNWLRDRTIEPEYELPDGRILEARTSQRGPYTPEDEGEEEA